MTDSTAIGSREDRAAYILRAVTKLPNTWNDMRTNGAGLRATFRRWRFEDGEPTFDMQSAIWAHAKAPDQQSAASGENRKPMPPATADEIVREAAIIVALRAVAGEHEGEPLPLGAALYRAGLSDLRMMRLVSSPRAARLESLRRAIQLLDRAGLGIRWDGKMVERIHDFLFGSEAGAKRSMNIWAGEYFAARAKDNSSDTSATAKNSTDTTPKE